MKLTDLKIGVRLGILAALLLFAVVVVGVQGWLTLNKNSDRSARAVEQAVLMQEIVDTTRHAQVQFKVQIQEWKNTLLRGNDPANFEKYQKAFAKEGDAARASLQKLKEMATKAGLDTAAVDDTHKALAELQAKYLEALKQYDPANKDSAQLVDGLVKGMDRAPTKKIDDIVAYVLDQAKKMATKATADEAASHKAASMWLLMVIGLAVALGAATTYWIVHSITKPLDEAVKVAQTVASGDLSKEIEVHSKDETGLLMEALKHMHDSLAKIVAEVRMGTESIATASGQIASGNLDLSSRTEQQASSIEETASSMEELTGTVKQNADNARQANSLALSASEVAAKGGAVVSEVVHTMGSINDSAKKIVDIISVIDGIAFQTNILALNAAVEAARAGEQGRGFAVVAAEVRNLAQRSAAAAKEIKTLISDSVEKVDAGAKLVDQAGATMDEVVASVKRVSDIIGEITAASQEQSSGIEQVNSAIAHMEESTQQNASLVEQAAAAADALQGQAGKLAEVVSIFKIDDKAMASVQPAIDVTPSRATLPPKRNPQFRTANVRRLQ